MPVQNLAGITSESLQEGLDWQMRFSKCQQVEELTLLVLDLGLDVVDCVGALHLQSDGLASEGSSQRSACLPADAGPGAEWDSF